MVMCCVSSKSRTRMQGWAGARDLQAGASSGGAGDLLVLGDERHFHILAGRGHQLPPLRCGRRGLLLVPAHADQEEKARDDQGNRDARNQYVQNSHPAAVLGTCEQQGSQCFKNHPPFQLQVLHQSTPSPNCNVQAQGDGPMSCTKGRNGTPNLRKGNILKNTPPTTHLGDTIQNRPQGINRNTRLKKPTNAKALTVIITKVLG